MLMPLVSAVWWDKQGAKGSQLVQCALTAVPQCMLPSVTRERAGGSSCSAEHGAQHGLVCTRQVDWYGLTLEASAVWWDKQARRAASLCRVP